MALGGAGEPRPGFNNSGKLLSTGDEATDGDMAAPAVRL
jgi:hypothetical protein